LKKLIHRLKLIENKAKNIPGIFDSRDGLKAAVSIDYLFGETPIFKPKSNKFSLTGYSLT